MGSFAQTRARLSAVALLMTLTAGCGGGGNGAEPATPPVTQPPPPISQLLDWDNHPAASAVLGQADTNSGSDGDLGSPQGSPAVTTTGRMLVVTQGALKAFSNYASGGPISEFTVPFSGVNNLSLHGNKLVVVENGRVRIYNNALIDADFDTDSFDVISNGLSGCGLDAMSIPRAAYLAPTGHLIVADTGNHRILIWNPDRIPQAGNNLPAPSVVVGQPDMDSCDQNAGGGTESLSEFTLNLPRAVWSDGTRLVVADEGNHRVLIWDQMPAEDFQPATHVVGQASRDSSQPNRGGAPSEFTLCAPQSVDVNEFGQMAVADSCNHRVLVWDSVPSGDSAAANHVLGQATFAGNALAVSPSARSLNLPTGVRFHSRNLIVVDHGNNRVLVFPASN